MAEQVYDASLIPMANSLQNLALAASTALTVPAQATVALITADGSADVRWADDGTTPTSTVGQLLKSGATMLYSNDLTALRAIRTAAGGSIAVSYYRVA